jgi:ABC-type sugar transport system substrate-binding protein
VKRTEVRRSSLIVVALAVLACTVLLVAPASNGGVDRTSAASAFPYLATAQAHVKAHVAKPTKILQTSKYTPIKGKLIYNISCSLAVVGCAQISGNIGKAAKAAGAKFQACDAGTTPTKANGCFTNAVNAKAAAIVVNAVGTNQAGIGYKAAATAGIPIIGVFTGNPLHSVGVKSEVAGTACLDEASLVADYVMVHTNGKANSLFVSEDTLSCDTQRTSAYSKVMKRCPTCKTSNLTFNLSTMTSDLPQKVTAALQTNPNLNYVAGVFDQVAGIASTAIRQAGKKIPVAGMDANPPNLQAIASGGLQNVDVTVGQGEVAWAGVDAAVRVISGQKVPVVTPVNYWIIDRSNIKQVPKGGFMGPNGYQSQFQALWK